ncbi:MAG: SufD family Fe-S cluster assembly protein [Bacilli bacterium]|jgi:Fe-S cluster assembly protein SufD|nr:SufD family Fe-S cluster assembly protein [Bacilli bacterium]
MNKYIEIVDDNIKTDLEYYLNNQELIFNIDNNYNIDVYLKNISYSLIMNFSESINVNITNNIDENNNKIVVNYTIEDNSVINEFFLINNDGLDIEYYKNISIKNNASYECSCALFNENNIDYNIDISLINDNAKAIHNVATIASHNKKYFNVKINNIACNTIGLLNNFGVVKNNGELIFNGIGDIKNGAKNAKAHQESKIITFDENVIAQANPYLIIDEADVEASHAAAVGQMDEEQLYYLQTRGISNNDASLLITYGYLKPILKNINNEELKHKLEKIIEDKVLI